MLYSLTVHRIAPQQHSSAFLPSYHDPTAVDQALSVGQTMQRIPSLFKALIDPLALLDDPQWRFSHSPDLQPAPTVIPSGNTRE